MSDRPPCGIGRSRHAERPDRGMTHSGRLGRIDCTRLGSREYVGKRRLHQGNARLDRREALQPAEVLTDQRFLRPKRRYDASQRLDRGIRVCGALWREHDAASTFHLECPASLVRCGDTSTPAGPTTSVSAWI